MGSLTILVLQFLFGCVGVNVLSLASIDDHLDERLRQTKIEIAKLHFREEPPVQRKLYNVQWNQLWEKDFGEQRPFVVNAFNKALVVHGDRVVAFPIDAESNQTAFQEVPLTRTDGPIKFVRSIVWKTMMYLLVCYETGSCSLYTCTVDFQLRHRQTMRHRGYPMDAIFFVRVNRLYLVVADNSGRFTMPSLIYHWRGTYMDVVTEVMTTAAVSVTAFKHKQSTIIVFAQNDKSLPGIGSMVYEFKETSPDRIQFLSTYDPVFVHHYNHAGNSFIFLSNEYGPSSLFWWDGLELLRWQQIPEIEAPSLISVINANDDTFFVVGRHDTLQLYKFENASDCTLLSSTKVLNTETVVDVQAEIGRSKMVLVTRNLDNVYSVRLWDLQIKELPSEHSTVETDVLVRHLSKLVEALQRRRPFVEEAESSWPALLPANEDLTLSEPLVLPGLVLESGTLGNIDVFVAEDVIPPQELERNLDALIRDVDDIFETSKNLLTSDNVNSLVGDIVVQGDASVQRLEIDKMDVNFLNNVDIRPKDDWNQSSDHLTIWPLRGENITVHNLEIDSLCGIPFQYWATSNDTSKMEINLDATKIEFSNDTILLHSNVSLTKLTTKTLNGVDVNKFLGELFLLNKNQTIQGNITYNGALEIYNLTTQTLNGKPWESYMNTKTEQNFDNFSINSLRVDNLHADSIHGVLVSEAARVSRENTIKGKVNIASLHVTEKLSGESGHILPETRTVVYSNVTVLGDLNVKVLNLDRNSKILLNGDEIHLHDIVENFWTKSTDQIFDNDVTFESNLIIDRLQTRYLNGFSEDEFLYTTGTVIPENFVNLHFENVLIDNAFFTEGKNDSLFDVSPGSLTIHERLHLKHLRGNELHVDVYNGLLVSDILNGSQLPDFSKDMSFSMVRAKQVDVDRFDFLSENGVDSVTFLENAGGAWKEQENLKNITVFRVENLEVERINDIEMKKLASLRDMRDLKNLVINGDLTVKGDLRIERIDDRPTEIYLKNMAKGDIVIDTEETIEELIVQDARIRSLQGHDVDSFFEGVLSKSREQIISGKFSFYKVTSNNVLTKFIDDEDTSKLKWIDEPLFLTGNVTFDDLLVDDVLTNTLNGHAVEELYESLLEVPVTKIKDLKVDGSISWTIDSSHPGSFTSLLENAVSKIKDQVIHGDTIFENGVWMSTVAGQWEEFDEIHSIVADAVIDDGSVLEVFGEKIFKENLSIDTLSVTNNIEIPVINNVDVLEFNSSVVRKDQDETVTGPVTFLEEVAINEMIADDDVHGLPLKNFALASDMLPPRVSFRNLMVLGDVYLKNLDGIDFDRFMKDRVTIDGDHDVFDNVQFNGIVEITGHANVTRINGIDPSDLVLDGTEETQLVYGAKVFEESVVVAGNINAPLLNGVNVSSEYSNGVQSDEDVEIVGDLIFESEVDVPENVSVSGLVNGMNLDNVLDDLKTVENETLRAFKSNETEMENTVVQSLLISETLRNVFFGLEAEETLKIQVPNIKTVDVVYYEKTTKLNMHGEEPGPACGLPRHCFCPTEYVAELTENDCRVRRTNGFTTARNYHELDNTFGINVITNTVSYSPQCTLNGSANEFTTVSWVNSETSKIKEANYKIRGFVKDAAFVAHDNGAFVILAIYYDASQATHRTDSLIYNIDLKTNILSLHQKLPTDGVWDIEVFQTNHHDIYLLLGCFENSEKSFLYRLDVTTSKFVMLRTFGGKTRYAKSLVQEEDRFVLLDDFDTNAVNIFHYDPEFDNFHNYQSLFHDSRVNGIECFYADEFGKSDSFLAVATENDQFYIYEYMFAQKFQIRVRHRMDDLRTMKPFYYSGNRYIFMGTSRNSTILRIVQQGPR
ncbi:uncharacterized protein LOC122399894 [Colletes gigas]|uniref:uncharacterized protein LOC122399894 n=1 Tax=Colletes gigas TaxID=935657 RepID=UPI001C9A438B|nr:uncharacterized protein LOC122399894 [Colletes gigas]